MTATAINDEAALTDAIADIVEARDSHEQWARYLRTNPDADPQEVKIAGDADYHVEWVTKYDRVLTILRARRNALRSRKRHEPLPTEPDPRLVKHVEKI